MDTQKKLKNYLSFLRKQPKGFAYFDTPLKKPVNQPVSNKVKLDNLCSKYTNCQSCPLATQGRTQVVFGTGDQQAKLMFIGEGPGRDENTQGLPFVGRAGKLLTKIIEAMGLTREEVWISNVVKCRPPNNRAPLPIESKTCKDLLLFKEIEIIKPKIICTLGATAVHALLNSDIQISKTRGTFLELNGIPLMPTYHPAYLLRNPSAKRFVWQDMKKIMEKLKEL